MMRIKMITMNDGSLDISLHPAERFNTTLMEAGLNQRSSFIYSQMNGVIGSRLHSNSSYFSKLDRYHLML